MKNPLPPSDSELQKFSDNMNKSLPIQIDEYNYLLSSKVNHENGFKIMDFFVLVKLNSSDINLSNLESQNALMVTNSCTKSPIKELLQQSTSVRYFYVSEDKKVVHSITILPRDCK